MYTSNSKQKLSIAGQLCLHIAVVGGIVLAAVGGSNLVNPPSSSNNINTDMSLLKAGYLILLLVVVCLGIYAARILLRLRRAPTVRVYNKSAMYLASFAGIALAFALVRVIYSIVFAFKRTPDLNPFTGTFAVKLIFIFLVQIIAASCLMVGGILSDNMAGKGETPTIVPHLD
jgi:hypothetical protein